MRETFKNISIFILFLITLLVWDAAKTHLAPHFNFRYGNMLLLFIWSSCVVVFFHLLYHYFNKVSDKNVYLSALVGVILTGVLVHFEVLPLP